MIQSAKKLLFPVALAVICLFAGWFLFYFCQEKAELTPQAAAEKAINFINENFLSEGSLASLVSVAEEGLIYKVTLDISGSEFNSYVSKDGKFLFPEGYEMLETEEELEEMVKSDRPQVDLFVMSFCPYGNLAENTMLPVYNLLKDDIDFNIHYVVNVNGEEISSLHGQPEVDQNMREVCVMDNSGMDKWWQFTTYVNDNCGSDGSCWQEAALVSGLNSQEIESCLLSKGVEAMKADAALSQEKGVSGSPTMIINGVDSSAVYSYGSPQKYLDAICQSFNSAPQACSEVIADFDATLSSGSCQ